MFIMPLKVKSVPNEVNFWCKWFLYNYGQNWNFSSEKTSKLQILSYKRVIYLKRNLRTYTKQIQPEKIRFFAKKGIFFNFFNFSRHARGPPKIFDVQFSKNFQKKFKKWLLWDLSILERNKVMSFGELSPDPVEMADGFMVGGAIMAPPRVK